MSWWTVMGFLVIMQIVFLCLDPTETKKYAFVPFFFGVAFVAFLVMYSLGGVVLASIVELSPVAFLLVPFGAIVLALGVGSLYAIYALLKSSSS